MELKCEEYHHFSKGAYFVKYNRQTYKRTKLAILFLNLPTYLGPICMLIHVHDTLVRWHVTKNATSQHPKVPTYKHIMG